MVLDIEPLSPEIGAVVRGVDLGRTLDAATQAALLDAFHRHVILLLRDQTLTENELPQAGSWLGTLVARGRPTTVRREDNPFITKVSNIRENGRLIGSLPDGEMFFHCDGAFYEKPHRTSFLYAVEIPSRGGNTLFANLYTAYDRLPQSLKRRLDDRMAVQSYDYSTYEKGDTSNSRQFQHPVFITHPVTGREAVYVTRLMTKQILGFDKAESDELLDEIFSYTEDPSLIYEHRWRPGDFLAWDNLSSAHARTDFSSAERRLLLRGMTVGDYRPVA